MMLQSNRYTRVFQTGTNESPSVSRPVKSGLTTVRIVDGALRCLSLGERELVRQIDFPVRDENWASLPPEDVFESFNQTDDGYLYERHFEVANGDLVCKVTYQITDGVIRATGEAIARKDFVTNRTGFTILHPIDGFAGKPVTVRYASGGSAGALLPRRICPSQPIKDIAGLTFDTDGIHLDIDFTGDVFEMEDQRNWSDASFKTYCRPLVEPFSYTIHAGKSVRQSVLIKMKGSAEQAYSQAEPKLTIGPPLDCPLPQLSLALQDNWFATDDTLRLLSQSGIKQFLLRVTPMTAATLLQKAKTHIQETNSDLDLEIVLDDDKPAEKQVERVASACLGTGISPIHVTALPAAYLKSYQPNGRWPHGLTPEDAFKAVKRKFPDAKVGGGMLTNFTEFNRRRPDTIASDFVTHGNTATVHAADDASVMQTLDALPHVFCSARAIAGNRDYRLGLTAIGMRSNPYGDHVSPNPNQQRLTMTVWDPRARALFGAAWAIGALAATEITEIDAITLAAPAGPFGILSSPGEVARPWFDDNPDARVYPMFHVLRALAGARRRLSLSGLPDGLKGIAIKPCTITRLLVANLTNMSKTLALPFASVNAVLDADSFADATRDPGWLHGTARFQPAGPIVLQPYAVLFSDISEGAK